VRSNAVRITLAVVVTLVLGAGAIISSPTPGTLEGRLEITPRKGVHLAEEPATKNEKVPCEDCSLVVLSKDGRSEIATVTTDKEGRFRISLPAGDYILDVKGRTRKRLLAAPKPFTVVAEQTVHVEMDVESGIEPM